MSKDGFTKTYAVTASTPTTDLQISNTDQTTAVPGAPVTYTVVVTNAGHGAVTGAGVTDTLPATLTASGRTLLKRAEAAVREADARVLAKLSAAEQQEFKRMLAALGAD